MGVPGRETPGTETEEEETREGDPRKGRPLGGRPEARRLSRQPRAALTWTRPDSGAPWAWLSGAASRGADRDAPHPHPSPGGRPAPRAVTGTGLRSSPGRALAVRRPLRIAAAADAAQTWTLPPRRAEPRSRLSRRRSACRDL